DPRNFCNAADEINYGFIGGQKFPETLPNIPGKLLCGSVRLLGRCLAEHAFAVTAEYLAMAGDKAVGGAAGDALLFQPTTPLACTPEVGAAEKGFHCMQALGKACTDLA